MIRRTAICAVLFAASALLLPVELHALPAAGCANCALPEVAADNVTAVYYRRSYAPRRPAMARGYPMARSSFGYRSMRYRSPYGPRYASPYSSYRGHAMTANPGSGKGKKKHGYSGVSRVSDIQPPPRNFGTPSSMNANIGGMPDAGRYSGRTQSNYLPQSYNSPSGGSGGSSQPGGSSGSSQPGTARPGAMTAAELEERWQLCEKIPVTLRIRISCCRPPFTGACEIQ